MKTRLAKHAVLFGLAAAISLATVVPALAQDESKAPRTKPVAAAGETVETEASIPAYAWYWRDQQQEKITNPTDGTDIATVELKNPYCPDTAPVGSPPEEVCQSGRLPVEVRAGDYGRPHKISAVNFDLSAVPPGSEILKFEVKLYEATDEQSRSTQYNLDGKRILACEVSGVFGEGEARLYKERPNYECKKDDASALRDSDTVGKGDNETEFFHWTLDLTQQAQEWMKKQVFFTSVMLQPKEPRDPAPEDQAWQVVFAGPLEKKHGIETKLVYESSGLALPPPPPPPSDDDYGDVGDDFDGGGTTFDGGSGSTTTTTTTTGDPGTASAPASDQAPAAESEAQVAEPAPAEGDETDLAGDEKSVPAGLPLYVWLAILGGMIGFSLVRSIVLEKSNGIRPDGVLAQIQRLNAQRRGGALAHASESSSPFAAVAAGLGSIGSKIGSGAGKLAQLVSRKKG